MPARNGNRFQQFVHGFVSFKLRESGIRLEGFNDDTAAPTLAALNLRRVTNELVMKNEALFSSMCDRLNLTDATTYATFVGIADEMFQTGYNWGRIVALFAFGGTISVYCARRTDLVANVDNLVQWLSTYMEQRLGSWFDSNGGWDGFNEFFQQEAHSPNQGGWGIAAAAGVGIGALLMLVCK